MYVVFDKSNAKVMIWFPGNKHTEIKSVFALDELVFMF